MILVTGATGTVGTQLVNELKKAGDEFRILTRDPGKGKTLGLPDSSIFVGDFSDRGSLVKAMDGVDRVFLLSAVSQETVELEGNVVNAAKEAGVQKVVKLSALGAGVDSPFYLGRLHGESEQKLMNSGLEWSIIRPHGFMQNILMGLAAIKSNKVLYSSLGEARMSFIDARDIAETVRVLLTSDDHKGKIYELTGPEAISYFDIAREISEVTGETISCVVISSDALRQGLIGSGMPEWLANSLVELFEHWKAGNGSAVSPSVEKITGKKPRTFSQFAKDHACLFK